MRLDRRHYNAWYGIGLTYYKQERFQLAEIYYRCSKLKRLEYQPNVSPRRALAISPNSPVLMCHVAVVQVLVPIDQLTSIPSAKDMRQICEEQL